MKMGTLRPLACRSKALAQSRTWQGTGQGQRHRDRVTGTEAQGGRGGRRGEEREGSQRIAEGR